MTTNLLIQLVLLVMSSTAFALDWPQATLDRYRAAGSMEEYLCSKSRTNLEKELCEIGRRELSQEYAKAALPKLTVRNSQQLLLQVPGKNSVVSVRRTDDPNVFEVNARSIDLMTISTNDELGQAIRKALPSVVTGSPVSPWSLLLPRALAEDSRRVKRDLPELAREVRERPVEQLVLSIQKLIADTGALKVGDDVSAFEENCKKLNTDLQARAKFFHNARFSGSPKAIVESEAELIKMLAAVEKPMQRLSEQIGRKTSKLFKGDAPTFKDCEVASQFISEYVKSRGGSDGVKGKLQEAQRRIEAFKRFQESSLDSAPSSVAAPQRANQ